MLLPRLKLALTGALLFLILILGFSLRLKNMASLPFPGESMDEYSNAWMGLSLIESGIPVGISGLLAYPHTDYFYINVDRIFQKGEQSPPAINYPWFDHPPMMGLVVGGFAKLSGANYFEDTTLSLIRRPLIIMGTLTILLVFIFTYQLFGYGASFLASAIYATSPLVVVSSRLIQAENGYLPLLLLSLIFLGRGLSRGKQSWYFLAGLTIGVALLFKIAAISGVLAGCLLITFYGQKSSRNTNLFHFLVPALTIGALFIVYGFAIDPKLFINIFVSNSTRGYGIGTMAIYRLLTDNKVTAEKSLTDGWIISAWLSSFYFLCSNFLTKSKKDLGQALIPLLSIIAVYFLFGSNPFGWYTFPIYPFIIAILGHFIYQSISRSKHLVPTFLALLIPIGIEIQKIISRSDLEKIYLLWKPGLPLLILLVILLATKPVTPNKRRLVKVIFITMLVLSLFFNYLYNLKLSPELWYQTN